MRRLGPVPCRDGMAFGTGVTDMIDGWQAKGLFGGSGRGSTDARRMSG
jgi:hypothetical protein